MKNSNPVSSEDDFDIPEVRLFLEKYPQTEIMPDHM